MTVFSTAPSRTLQIFQRGDQKLLLWTGPQDFRAVATPDACHSTSELHSLISDLFSSTTHSKRGESSFHVVISEMEQKKDKKKIHNFHVEGLFYRFSFLRCLLINRKGWVKTATAVTLILHQEYNTLCLTPFWRDKASFSQCMRQHES